MIISDAVDGLEAAITAQLADLDGLAVTVTTSPELADAALTQADLVVLIGVPTIEWATWSVHSAEVPVHLIAGTPDYLRGLRLLDVALTQLVADSALAPTTARPTSYQRDPTSPAYPALTCLIQTT